MRLFHQLCIFLQNFLKTGDYELDKLFIFDDQLCECLHCIDIEIDLFDLGEAVVDKLEDIFEMLFWEIDVDVIGYYFTATSF